MKIRALNKETRLRANFELEIFEGSVKLTTPNGEQFYLIRDDIIHSLGISEYEKLEKILSRVLDKLEGKRA